jgi:integrase
VHLWRHENGFWYVRFGPRLRSRISTQTKNRGDADKFLARFIATEGEPTGGRRTVGEILAGYQADKATKVRAPEAIRFAVMGLQPLAPLYPSQLTPPNITRWAGSRGVSNGTVLREVGVLRAALSWAVEHQWLGAVPPISNPVPTPKGRSRWVTKPEAKALLAACREPHVKLFTMLGLMTVARSGAILEARWDQVDFERRVLDYGEGHGNKQRALVPLNDDVFATLQAAKLMACSDHIVEFRGNPVTSIKNGFAAACRRADIKGVTPHILRHSGATWMAIDGVPLEEIARMLGDSLAVVEKTYAKWTPEYLRRAAGALQLSD